ncbi:MAG: hypothetical protein U0359_13705 [Byssovorax sp.]
MHKHASRTLASLSAVSCAAALLFTGGAARAEAQRPYTFTTFDAPDAAGATFTIGINNHRDLSGSYIGAEGLFHGYVVLGGAYQPIDVPGASQTVVTGINDSRVITGVYFDAAGFQHGFQLKHGQVTTIDDPDAVETVGIPFEFGPGLGTATFNTNASGRVVGQYADAAGYSHGFFLDGGVFHTIDVAAASHDPAMGTEVIALNDKGDLGGSYRVSGFPFCHGFVSYGGQMFTLDVPAAGGTFGTQVNSINNRGEVAGPYTDPSDQMHGFIYKNGQFRTVDYPGSFFSEIDTINDHGDIVGEYVGADGALHGYMATR